tara:strand:+ start:133 stop:927 length:795 start_codon:yes stop_codon:yes gene_type:complete
MKKYFVIGNPINHSLSPKLHNYWLNENKIDAYYEKIKIEPKEIKKFIDDIKKQKISGCNVTVPYKNTVIQYLDKLSTEAKQTQSVNTIVYDNGNLIGHNTDIAGFGKAIKNLNFEMKNKKILILGAGGVVPSIIFALTNMDVLDITISNRTIKKAKELKYLYNNLSVIEWGHLPDFDVIINATSLGLNNEKMSLDFSKIGKNKLFYDVIYNPTETNFLITGKELGNQTENGKLMFVYQAFESFKMWHNIEPKINNEILKFLEND